MGYLEKKKINLEKKINVEKEERTIFTELSHIFRTVVQILGDRKSIETVRTPRSEAYLNRDELIVEAQKICKELATFKADLTKEFGQASYLFITKSIDPIIDKAIFIINEIQLESEGKYSLSDRAIQSAQLYLQFSDENRLRRRIVADGVVAIREAIEKDIQVLEHYAHHAFQDTDLDVESYESYCAAKLQPIIDKLYAMQVQPILTDDLREFFLWKSQIDEKRSLLTEEGFMIIDNLIASDQKEQPFHETESSSEDSTEADWSS